MTSGSRAEPARRFERPFPLVPLGVALSLSALIPLGLTWSIDYFNDRAYGAQRDAVRSERLRGTILHLDEVLTMSTRMAAASGDLVWQERYQQNEAELDRAIRDLTRLAGDAAEDGVRVTNAANERLVEMEGRAFEAVRAGDLERARAILRSEGYAREKVRYARGMARVLAAVDASTESARELSRQQSRLAVAGSVASLLLLLGVWVTVLRGLRRWRREMIGARDELSQMADALQASNDTLEEQVALRGAIAEQRLQRLEQVAIELSEAEQRERQRVAKVIHDQLQQLLVAARMRLRSTLKHTAEGGQDAGRHLDALLAESIDVSRSLSLSLHPPELEEGGLVAGTEWLAAQMRDTHGLEVEVALDEDVPEPDAAIAAFLFESMRELFFNVVKHAETDRCRVSVASEGEELEVVVEDDGRGFEPPAPRSLGMFRIEERVKLLGGRFEVTSSEGEGTRVSLVVPVRRASSGGPEPALESPAVRDEAAQ